METSTKEGEVKETRIKRKKDENDNKNVSGEKMRPNKEGNIEGNDKRERRENVSK